MVSKRTPDISHSHDLRRILRRCNQIIKIIHCFLDRILDSVHAARNAENAYIDLVRDDVLDDLNSTLYIWTLISSDDEENELVNRKVFLPCWHIQIRELLCENTDELLAGSLCHILQIRN